MQSGMEKEKRDWVVDVIRLWWTNIPETTGGVREVPHFAMLLYLFRCRDNGRYLTRSAGYAHRNNKWKKTDLDYIDDHPCLFECTEHAEHTLSGLIRLVFPSDLCNTSSKQYAYMYMHQRNNKYGSKITTVKKGCESAPDWKIIGS